jgi:hypothetical protein
VAKYRWSNTFAQLLVDIWIPPHLLEFLLVLLGNIWLGKSCKAARTVINQ